MKEDRELSAALGSAVTKPDILAQVERGEEAAGPYGEHRSPRPHAAPHGSSQGDWLGKEVKSEEGASPLPASPPTHPIGPGDFPVPPPERGCSYCGAPEPAPGAGNGGFVAPPPIRECGECGRGFGQKPDLVRHRLGHGGDSAHACGRCGRGFTGTPGRPPGPCAGRSPGTTEGTGAPRKERKELSLTEKVRVLEMLEGPKVSQSELAKRFGVSQPQICRIIKNRERILGEWHRNGDPERKRKREGKDAALEAALLRWVEGTRAARLPLSPPLLHVKAKHLAQALGRPDPEPNGGWLARFGARHNLAFKKPPAEDGDAEQPTAERWAGAVLPGLLRSYAAPEIYACGETGILLPAGSPGEGESGGERLSLLLCANADGSEKLPLRAVGESPRPRCLQGVNLEQMPWSYRAGSSAGVTAPLFTEWLREFNEGMRRQGKSALLLLAKHRAQPHLQLSHVRMVFVPPAASLADPLDRGITGDLKGHYRRRLLRWLSVERGVEQPSLLDVLHMLAQAWGDVRPGLIAGCFRAAGFGPAAGTQGPAPGALTREQPVHRAGEEPERRGDVGTREEEEEEDGGAMVARRCPSEREVWGSLATLRRYLECRATSPGLFQAFYGLEDAVHAVTASAGTGPAGDIPSTQ
ncbi:tigger transposable element-derived protein 3-like isoform X2 [Heliangelus exortis]|uniref:tigger transposable element-derived protein 3-like isoform X2 n=1 Tax=Heliangelus exortis TaxID=472823 RepID=UPI003A949BB4